MLTDIDEKGGMYEVHNIEYRARFDAKWSEFTPEEQQEIDSKIAELLDELVNSPPTKWGAIMNTSMEGGKANPFNGQPGDWSGTAYQSIWRHHNRNAEHAALFFGTLWKLRIIERPEQWIGVRNADDRPTFPNKGITLRGKTYFLANRS